MGRMCLSVSQSAAAGVARVADVCDSASLAGANALSLQRPRTTTALYATRSPRSCLLNVVSLPEMCCDSIYQRRPAKFPLAVNRHHTVYPYAAAAVDGVHTVAPVS